MRLFDGIKQRNIGRYLLAYVAGGWLVLQVIDQLIQNSVIPPISYRATLVLFICGLPSTLIISWFHGEKGHQEVPRIEKVLLSGIALTAVVASSLVLWAGITPETGDEEAELSVTQDPRRVAVLYFEPRGGEDAELLASGLTEALIDNLATVDALHVVSRNGSRLVRGLHADADSVGRMLEVGTLVEGTVARAGDRVRLDITLTNAATGSQYASTRMEHPRAELFELQDLLADTVAMELRRAIGAEFGAVRLRRGTQVLPAWEAVQEARIVEAGALAFVQAGDIHGAEVAHDRADSLFAIAEATDPAWLEPVVRRGWTAYSRSRLGGLDQAQAETWIATGLGHAERALALNPSDAGALELRATLQYWKLLLNLAGSRTDAARVLHEAEAGFRAAVAADANRASALASLSHLLLYKGGIVEAKLMALRAYEADPFLENANLTLWRIVQSSWDLADGVEARHYCDEGLRRFPDDYRFRQCRLMVQALPDRAPDVDEAWTRLEEFAAMSPPPVRELNRHRGLLYVSMALARGGLPDSARAVALRGRAGAEIDPLRDLARLESVTRTWVGDYDEATRLLGLHIAANPGLAEAYRAEGDHGELPWYHRALADQPRFRTLVGLP